MDTFLILVATHTAVGAACWYFGWRQGKRGLPVVSSHPTL